jgi:hypothetical protein
MNFKCLTNENGGYGGAFFFLRRACISFGESTHQDQVDQVFDSNGLVCYVSCFMFEDDALPVSMPK